MEHIKKGPAAQGDCIVLRIKKLPDQLKEVPREGGALIVAHSETGHHHVIRDAEVRMFEALERDPLIAYLQIDALHADLVHERNWDTHETLRLKRGLWQIIRQREHAQNESIGPWAGRRAAD